MPGYLIVTMKAITDPDKLGLYREAAAPSVREFGGKLIISPRTKQRRVEGGDHAGIIVFKFPSYEDAINWYHSPSYQEAIKIRLGAVDVDISIVEGGE